MLFRWGRGCRGVERERKWFVVLKNSHSLIPLFLFNNSFLKNESFDNLLLKKHRRLQITQTIFSTDMYGRLGSPPYFCTRVALSGQRGSKSPLQHTHIRDRPPTEIYTIFGLYRPYGSSKRFTHLTTSSVTQEKIPANEIY